MNQVSYQELFNMGLNTTKLSHTFPHYNTNHQINNLKINLLLITTCSPIYGIQKKLVMVL